MDFLTCPRCYGSGFEPPACRVPCSLCRGLQEIEDFKLSENFHFSEWCRAYEGCPNDPDAQAIERAKLTLSSLLEPARAICGPLGVTSGYRCPELDVIADGGNKHWLTHLSGHAIGSAFDVRPLGKYVNLRMLFKMLIQHHKGPWDQLIAEGGCIHCAAEGPVDGGRKMAPPGKGAQRKHVLIRRLRTKDDPPGWKFIYDPFDDTDVQWLKVV